MIILPRQARDKQRESTQKQRDGGCVCHTGSTVTALVAMGTGEMHHALDHPLDHPLNRG
jgi:hypothetical protein